MKRISTPAPDENFNSLKPLIGTSGNPPFYDPNDIHVHVWKKGMLGIEDNPKIPTYSKEKINIRNCEYCKICHLINKKFVSDVNKKHITLKDYIEKPTNVPNVNYIIKNTHISSPINVEINKEIKETKETKFPNINYNLMFKIDNKQLTEYIKIIN